MSQDNRSGLSVNVRNDSTSPAFRWKVPFAAIPWEVLQSDWYNDLEAYGKLMVRILFDFVQWTAGSYRGVQLSPGQVFISSRRLASDCSTTKECIEGVLRKLKKKGVIALEGNHSGTKITFLQWEDWVEIDATIPPPFRHHSATNSATNSATPETHLNPDNSEAYGTRENGDSATNSAKHSKRGGVETDATLQNTIFSNPPNNDSKGGVNGAALSRDHNLPPDFVQEILNLVPGLNLPGLRALASEHSLEEIQVQAEWLHSRNLEGVRSLPAYFMEAVRDGWGDPKSPDPEEEEEELEKKRRHVAQVTGWKILGKSRRNEKIIWGKGDDRMYEDEFFMWVDKHTNGGHR